MKRKLEKKKIMYHYTYYESMKFHKIKLLGIK